MSYAESSSPHNPDVAPSWVLFASIGLFLTSMRWCSLLATYTLRWFQQPGVPSQNEFSPICSGDIDFLLRDERFPVELFGSYDIDLAKSIIAEAPRTSRPTDVAFWKAFMNQMESQHISTFRHSTANCSIPVIIATVDAASGNYMLIDGWHRIGQATAEGRNVIQAFYLTEAETKEIFKTSWDARAKGSFE
jgi:hypothetical protein